MGLVISFTNGPQAHGTPVTPFGPGIIVFARFYKGFRHFVSILAGRPAGRPADRPADSCRMFFCTRVLAEVPSSDLPKIFRCGPQKYSFCPDKKSLSYVLFPLSFVFILILISRPFCMHSHQHHLILHGGPFSQSFTAITHALFV